MTCMFSRWNMREVGDMRIERGRFVFLEYSEMEDDSTVELRYVLTNWGDNSLIVFL